MPETPSIKETIIQQLSDYCPCFSDLYKEHADDMDKSVDTMINVVSYATCWTNKPCETFINSEREEIHTIGKIKRCGCDAGIFCFTPFYTNITPDTIKVIAIVKDGIKEIPSDLESDKYTYNEYTDQICIDLSDYINECNCDCTKLVKVVVTYDAGFEMIPDCLLKLFCNMFAIIHAQNCSSCNNGTDPNITTISEGNEIIFDDVNMCKSIEYHLTDMITKSFVSQISLISLCSRNRYFKLGVKA